MPLLNSDSKLLLQQRNKGIYWFNIKSYEWFWIEVINNDYREFVIKGNQRYNARNYRVEGDYSQAAFFLCADALGNNVLCKDLDLKSLQGDKEVIDILKRMNVEFTASDKGVKAILKEKLVNTIIDGSQCPDIIPVLTAVAALSEGTTEIINAGRLRIKECDRLAAVTMELNKLGAKIIEKEDGLVVTGVSELQGGVEVWSHNDHR